MKKVFILVLFVVMNLYCTQSVYAQTIDKYVDVQITSSATTVNVGEKVILTTKVEKNGSGYIDDWTGAEIYGTQLDTDTGSYISVATFKADKPGVYEIRYDISMSSGKSDNIFKGSGICVIEVKGEVGIIGAEIADISMDAVELPDGRLLGYSAMGNIYILRSDNTRTLYSTIFFFFEPDEVVKDIETTIEESGKTYRFNLCIVR